MFSNLILGVINFAVSFLSTTLHAGSLRARGRNYHETPPVHRPSGGFPLYPKSRCSIRAASICLIIVLSALPTELDFMRNLEIVLIW